jgi:hypothetical protein
MKSMHGHLKISCLELLPQFTSYMQAKTEVQVSVRPKFAIIRM